LNAVVEQIMNVIESFGPLALYNLGKEGVTITVGIEFLKDPARELSHVIETNG
jgi:hypothetical protein